MTSDPEIPSVERLVEDLRTIVVAGIERFSFDDLQALPALQSLRPPSRQPPNVLTVKQAVIDQVSRLEPVWKRNSALALLGLTETTHASPLPKRRESAGSLWNPPAAESTFRGPRGGEHRLLAELAATLHQADAHMVAYSALDEPDLTGVRSRWSLEAEHRLGYRWRRYRRLVSPSDTGEGWRNTVRIEIEALRKGVRQVEYDYPSKHRFTIIGKPTVEPATHRSDPSYGSSVNAGFASRKHMRARFDVGRELAVGQTVALTFSYLLDEPLGPTPLDAKFGVVPRFDRMASVELAWAPRHPERGWVHAEVNWYLAAIHQRHWHAFVPEDRRPNGDYAGIFTVSFAEPLAGVSYSLEGMELENVDIRKALSKAGNMR